VYIKNKNVYKVVSLIGYYVIIYSELISFGDVGIAFHGNSFKCVYKNMDIA
jgi:hypothetical protein